jgi:hypothetical protein
MGHVGMRRVKPTEFRLRNLKKRYLLVDPGLDGHIILKRIWKKENWKTRQNRDKFRTLVKKVKKFRVS